MNAPTEIATLQEPPPYFADPVSTNSLILKGDSMERMMQTAEVMATSRVTVPKHLQNSQGDCLAVIMQAMQWGMNPFAVAQKTHLVNGTLGYEAQLVNAVVQSSGAITGRFHYEYQGSGNTLECRVGAVPRGESEVVWNEWLKISDVTTKNSPLWKTNPKQQIGYLQVKNWARAYAPGAILGVYTEDELRDSEPREKNVTPGAAETEPSFYPQDQFDKNFNAWKKHIESGKKTADQVIAMVESKAKLTEEQKEKIHAVRTAIEGESIEVASPELISKILGKAEDYAINESDICKHLGVKSLEGITVTQAEAALAFINNPTGE